jgi:hypothetical protein
MNVTILIPEEFAKRLAAGGDLSRRALEALALEEYRVGRLTKSELQRLLGFDTGDALDGFLKAHDMVQQAETGGEKARQAAANIIARRKNVTLGGHQLKDLISEGRP